MGPTSRARVERASRPFPLSSLTAGGAAAAAESPISISSFDMGDQVQRREEAESKTGKVASRPTSPRLNSCHFLVSAALHRVQADQCRLIRFACSLDAPCGHFLSHQATIRSASSPPFAGLLVVKRSRLLELNPRQLNLSYHRCSQVSPPPLQFPPATARR